MKVRSLVLAILVGGCGAVGGSDAGNGNMPDAPSGVTATFTSLYGDYFGTCSNCHTPSAPGRTSDTEQTLDFSTRATAYMTIKTGMASGLMGNFADCNGVPFVGATAGSSLILAALDQPTRQAFDRPASPMCDVDTISDETKWSGAPSAEFIAALKTWLGNGAPNN
jgi:hypothetical protein